MARELLSAIYRNGKEVELWRDAGGTDDAFGHEDESWTLKGTYTVTRSYPNRNTTAEENSGPLQRDRPVFFFRPDAGIQSGDYIKYDGTFYELESKTPYDSHISVMANAVQGFSPT